MAGQKRNNIDPIGVINTISSAYMAADYKESPVPIGTFLSDERYLGKITEKGQTIYPFWRGVLSDIAADDTRYLSVLTGAIGCLGPKVKVSLLDGRELTIPEIIEERKEGKQHWTYSYDIIRKKIVPGKIIDAMLSGKSVDNIVEVKLDNKERILCTHDHPFLASSGVYKKSEELEPGDSLMSLYREQGSGTLSKRRKHNHKVVSVKYWDEPVDVYDLSIERYHNFALTSGVFVHNTGKTCTAIAAVCFGMYRVLCLKSPWSFYGKTAGGKMAIVFFNLTQTLSASKGYNLLQSYLLSSPWFRSRGFVVGSAIKPRIDFPIFEYKFASPYAKGYGFTGEDVIFAIMDEVDSEDESEKQKMRIIKAYEAAVTRFESRFVRIGKHSGKRETLGRFFLCASKQEKLSFLNTFIVKMKNSPIVRVVDAALWEVKTDLNFSGEMFPIMLGDSYTPSKILGWELEDGFKIDEAGVADAKKNGFEITQIPIEFLERFQKDISGNLRRLAGISVDQLRKSKLFPSEKLLIDCYDPAKKDPVSMLTIDVGLSDDIDLTKYLDFSAIRVPRHRPRYIHVDIAYSGNGDALGLGMSCISGSTDAVVEDNTAEGGMRVEKLPIVETDFGMRIKARPGDKIPLNKIRKFIGDLKEVYGFNVQLVTYDYAALSEESKQILTRFGIKCEGLSLDKSPEIYRGFRTLVSENRWCCHKNDYLHFELVNLEDDSDKNRVDHPDEVVAIEYLSNGETREVVLKGSKDLSDGIVGSVENALRHSAGTAPMEFANNVRAAISQPKIVNNPMQSLVDLARKKPIAAEKEEIVDNETNLQFRNIFDKSQQRFNSPKRGL